MTKKCVWEFDRYVDGRLKAEGVRISRETTFENACLSAVSLASPGSVLVLRPPAEPYARMCLKHGPHSPGTCPQCDELAEARMVVSTVVIPAAPRPDLCAGCGHPLKEHRYHPLGLACPGIALKS